jgi:thiol-disulfide isomerase/thioredoxin
MPACEEAKDPPSAPKARSQAIVAQGQAESPATAPVPAPAASSVKAKARGVPLCAGQLTKPGKPLSKLALETQVAAGEAALPEALELGKGRWTWLNFWAAWCVPCREEIPRLKGWQRRLGERRFRLTFISLDDDARQLTQFVAKQPPGGLRQSYWIKEGDTREEWFAEVSMGPDPELPAHILVDPKGLARCIVNGAIEDSDFADVRSIVSGS